jgi:hypothetical protein
MKSKFSVIRSITRGTFIVLLSVAVFACSSKSELANHIPKDANVVMALDIKSMGYKSLDLNQILTFENVKKALSDLGKKDTATTKFENSGIDFLSKAYVFGKAEQTAPFGGVVVALSDAGKFETFLKELSKEIEIKKEGELNVATMTGETSVALVWSDSKVIALFGKEKLKETAITLMNLEKENSLAANNAMFSDLEKEAADISFWANFSDFDKLAQAYGQGANPAAMINLKETYLAATCNFEDGQVVVNTKYTTNKENAEKMSFIKQSVSTEVANALPGQTVIGMLGMALDMPKIQAYLEKEKLLDAYGPFASQYTGLTAPELLNMLSGDVAISVNGFKMAEVKTLNWSTGEEVTKMVPEPNYSAVLGISNKENLQKLLSYLEQAGMLTKGDKYYSFQDKVFLTEQGNTLIVTGTAEANQLAVTAKNEKLNEELMGMITGNATSFYLNFENVPQDVYNNVGALVASNVSTSEVVDILATGTTASETVSTGKFVIRFKNKSENSLVTITRVSKKFAERMKETPVVSTMEPASEVVEEVAATEAEAVN